MCVNCTCKEDKAIQMEEVLLLKALLRESIELVRKPRRSEITEHYIERVEKVISNND